MILNNLKPVNCAEPINIKINDGKIAQVSSSPITTHAILRLDFNNAIVFPD